MATAGFTRRSTDLATAVGKARDDLPLPFPVLDDGSDVRAPIAGVVAALRAARNDVCLFLPVDVPLISSESLLQLAANAPAAPPTGPLPGAYRKARGQMNLNSLHGGTEYDFIFHLS